MGLAIRDAGNTLRSASGLSIRDAGNVLRQAASIAFRDASNTLRTIFLSGGGYTVSPGYAQGTGASASTIFVTSNTVYILGVPSGATIVWHIDNGSISIVTPTAGSTQFRAHLASGVTETGNAYATVNGQNTQEVVVELTNLGIA